MRDPAHTKRGAGGTGEPFVGGASLFPSALRLASACRGIPIPGLQLAEAEVIETTSIRVALGPDRPDESRNGRLGKTFGLDLLQRTLPL